ncbi:TetR/AcrR family transcriptional regulator [Luteimonas deserti]|uniref:TetR/AcrR family transcriptional regulator n=1 Tax=Luteimonas deserti TaxID=2752306 RepID=A0A7Z0TYN7_9GAMM|nr:TetR/AcrR family transcriptional regulator [Luteimonas deserti]NYZ61343.1 TetR/AcrR family transcriptional regulator [Luteimonas deserti]
MPTPSNQTPTDAPAPAARTPRKRARGRPSARSPDLRPQLLDAALACYVRHGMAAASLRQIAREALVTPALLHYYFGDRVQLQQAVIEERVLPLVLQLRGPVAQAGDDMAGLISGFVRGIGRLVEHHPWLPTLWVREVLCEGGAMRQTMIDTIGPRLPRIMVERFADAQARGALNADLDPRLLMVSLIGLSMFPLAAAPLWRAMFGAHDLSPDALNHHTLVLLDRGLELDGAR